LGVVGVDEDDIMKDHIFVWQARDSNLFT